MISSPWQKPFRGMQINKSHPLARGLVGCWVMNEATGDKIFDLSGYDNHGTNVGSKWIARGLDLVSTNSDYIDCTNIIESEGIGLLTISATIQPGKSHTGYENIVNKAYGVSTPYNTWAMRFDNAGHIRFEITNTTPTRVLTIGSTVISQTTPTNVICVYNGIDLRIYINGVLDNTPAPQSGNIVSGRGYSVFIGKWGESASHYDGLIGNVALHNRNLSVEEVAWLHREPYAMFQPEISSTGLYNLGVSTETKDFTIDSQLINRHTKEFTINAILQSTETKEYSIDAILKATETKDFTINATLTTSNENKRRSVVGIFPVPDGSLNRLDRKHVAGLYHGPPYPEKYNIFTVDSILKATNTKIFTIDSNIVDRFDKALTADTILKATQSKEFNINALLKATATKNVSINSILKATSTKDVSIDAILKATTEKTFNIDSILSESATYTKEFSTDVIIEATNSKEFTIDSVLSGTNTKDFTINATLTTSNENKRRSVVGIFPVPDGSLNQLDRKHAAGLYRGPAYPAQYKTFTVDSLLKTTNSKEFIIDSILKATFTKDFSIDSIIEATNSKEFSTNALLKTTFIKDFSIDSVLEATEIKTFTTDSILKATVDKIFSIDAIIQTPFSKTFTIDSILLTTESKGFIIDSILKATNTKDLSINAVLKGTYTNEFTIDAVTVEFPVITPDSRTLVITAENRTIVITAENRTIIITY